MSLQKKKKKKKKKNCGSEVGNEFSVMNFFFTEGIRTGEGKRGGRAAFILIAGERQEKSVLCFLLLLLLLLLWGEKKKQKNKNKTSLREIAFVLEP